MAQLLVTLFFTAVMIFAARLMLRELARPLVNGPACWDDALYDALCDGRGGLARRSAPPRIVNPAPRHLPLPAVALS
jgi:hypothetical protein